jgi:hypothetical protein
MDKNDLDRCELVFTANDLREPKTCKSSGCDKPATHATLFKSKNVMIIFLLCEDHFMKDSDKTLDITLDQLAVYEVLKS